MTQHKCLPTSLEILHFNDVYNVEGHTAEPLAGAARFRTALEAHGAGSKALVLFSGDALSPSMISTITQGRHVPPILNNLYIACSVLGNHELDFGLDILYECLEACKFPWLCTNVFDQDTNEPLAGCSTHHIITHQGVRIGLIGLLESEWLVTLSCVDADDLIVEDMCDVGRTWAKKLKAGCVDGEEACDLVIALTHMRWPNDRRLAAEVPEIDLILGGHDHNYGVEWQNEEETRAIIKSGTDYQEFSHIHLQVDMESKRIIGMNVDKVIVDGSWKMDEGIATEVKLLTDKLDRKLDIAIGRIEVPLDARFCAVRTRETNVGNFVTDIILTGVDTDVAIVNSGTLRADRIIEAGEFRLRDLTNLLPMLDPLVVIQATGEQILKALENGVSQYPKLEGRFPLVAGIRFAFDPKQPPGQRISLSTVFVQDQPIVLNQSYKLCVKSYMANGKDGYDVLTECPVLVDDENGPILSTLVQNYFRTILVLKGFERARTTHRQSIVPIVERHRLVAQATASLAPLESKKSKDYWLKAKRVLLEECEQRSAHRIAPDVDGRIQILSSG